MDTHERFWKKVDKTETCWLWTAACNQHGYGLFSVRVGKTTKSHSAHRFAYELVVGPIPEGLQLDHLCRVPNCVNPEHLEPVTQQENYWRSPHKGSRTHCTRGHEFTEENTFRPRDGFRRCRACIEAHKRL